MADRLLELLRKREAGSATAKLQTPRYMDAMVFSKGSVDDINKLRFLDANPSNVIQSYNVAVDPNSTLSPRTTWSSIGPERYLLFDYQEEDYLDPEQFT